MSFRVLIWIRYNLYFPYSHFTFLTALHNTYRSHPFIDAGNPRSQPRQHPAALHLLGPTWCVLMECRSATVQSTSGSGDPEPLQVMTAFSPSRTVRFTWLTLISGRSGRADIEVLRCGAVFATGHMWIQIPPSCLSNQPPALHSA